MKYLFKNLAPLILLYIASGVITIGGFTGIPAYSFFQAYFAFATFVIIIGIASHFFGEALPRKFNFEKKPFASFSWEQNGRIYSRLGIEKWKDRVFDMGKAGLGTESKDIKKSSGGMKILSSETLEKMIQETCVAEVTHFALILVSPVIFFICRTPWSILLWICDVASNLSDILIQRYNRPRLVKLYHTLLKKEAK